MVFQYDVVSERLRIKCNVSLGDGHSALQQLDAEIERQRLRLVGKKIFEKYYVIAVKLKAIKKYFKVTIVAILVDEG